jgi:acid stress-induced BolA-like protein IbaG/YrbA
MSSINDAIRDAIAAQIADAQIAVSGDGRHFNIEVTAAAFDGLNTLERHRLVLSSLKELMAGDDAAVHAIDSLKTKTP